MLVCSVSMRPRGRAIPAVVAEVGAAADTLTRLVIYDVLVDNPALASDTVTIYLGEPIVEAASAVDTVSVMAGAIDADVVETAAADSTQDGSVPVTPATYDGLATNVVVSNGGRTVLHNVTTTNSGAVSTAFESTGKYYFEVKLEGGTASANYLGIIVSTWTSVFSASQMTTMGTGVQLGGSSIIFTNGATTSKNLGAQATNDVFSCAIDLTAHLGWFRKNGGNWNADAAADPATGTGGVTIAAGSFAPIVRFGTSGAGDNQMTGNFGQAAFVYSAPSGFGNWPA